MGKREGGVVGGVGWAFISHFNQMKQLKMSEKNKHSSPAFDNKQLIEDLK